VAHESPAGPFVREHTRKLNVVAEIVPPAAAEEAGLARHARLNCDAVADAQVWVCFGSRGADGEDGTRGFVAKGVRRVYGQAGGAQCAAAPEVNVATADAGGLDVEEDGIWGWFWDGRVSKVEGVVCSHSERQVNVLRKLLNARR
jgi:hypothetical protein